MTPEEIKALIEETVTTAIAQSYEKTQSDISGAVSRVSKTFEKKLDEFSSKPAQPESAEETDQKSMALQTLQQQLKELQSEREADKKEAQRLKRDAVVLEQINSLKVNNPNQFRKLFLAEYGSNIQEEDGKFYLLSGEDSKPLDKAMADYLSSEDGQIFQPASKVKGSGSKGSDAPPTTSTDEDLSSLINAAFKR